MIDFENLKEIAMTQPEKVIDALIEAIADLDQRMYDGPSPEVAVKRSAWNDGVTKPSDDLSVKVSKIIEYFRDVRAHRHRSGHPAWDDGHEQAMENVMCILFGLPWYFRSDKLDQAIDSATASKLVNPK